MQRGLALRKLKLNRSHESWIERKFGGQDEIYFVSAVVHGGDKEPIVFPTRPEGVEEYFIPMKAGEIYEFDLGVGAPIFPERELKTGIAVSLFLFEADNSKSDAGKTLTKVSEKLNNDGSLAKTLAKAVKAPGAFAADQVLGAAGEVAALIGAALEDNQRDFVAFFTGYFPPTGKWADMLEGHHPAATITLREIDVEM